MTIFKSQAPFKCHYLLLIKCKPIIPLFQTMLTFYWVQSNFCFFMFFFWNCIFDIKNLILIQLFIYDSRKEVEETWLIELVSLWETPFGCKVFNQFLTIRESMLTLAKLITPRNNNVYNLLALNTGVIAFQYFIFIWPVSLPCLKFCAHPSCAKFLRRQFLLL